MESNMNRSEIERLKTEIEELKREDKTFQELSLNLTNLHKKFEKFKEEKRLIETNLNDRLNAVKEKVSENDFEKDRLEKDITLCRTHLKNTKISQEEYNELLSSKQEELEEAYKSLRESEDLLRQKQIEMAKIEKDIERLYIEKKDHSLLFQKSEEELKVQLRIAKDLEEEESSLVSNEARLCTEIDILERELDFQTSQERDISDKLKSDEEELDKVIRYEADLDREVLEARENCSKMIGRKEELNYKIKQEGQKVVRLESNLKQNQQVLSTSDENCGVLIDKLEILEARIAQKLSENAFNTNMLKEDKRELERQIALCEETSDKLNDIASLHKTVIDKINFQSKNSHIAELKNEMLKLVE